MADATASLEAYPAGRALLKTLAPLDEATRKTATQQAARLLVEAACGKENVGGHTINSALQPTVPALCQVPDLNLVNPRGKFTLSIYQDSLTFSNQKSELRIPKGAIADVVILERLPKDQKGRLLLLLSLSKDAAITMGKQQLDTLVIQTFESADLSVPMVGGETQSGPAAVVLCTLLGMMGVKSYLATDASVFTSSTGSAAIVATHKVTPGCLFPLPTALCFVEKPALLIPHTSIKWFELLRIDRPTTTFDLVIHLLPGHPAGSKVALDQVERSELSRLQTYLAACRIKTSCESDQAASRSSTGPARAAGAEPSQLAVQAAANAEGDDDDDSEDEDEEFDPHAAASGSDQGSSDSDEDDDDNASNDDSDEESGGQGGKGEKAAPSSSKPRISAPTKPADDEEEDIGSEDEDDDEDEEEEDEYEMDDDSDVVEEDPLEAVNEPPSKRAKGRG